MKPENKIKQSILFLAHLEDEAITLDLDLHPCDTDADVEYVWTEIQNTHCLQDYIYEFREGQFKTGITSASDYSRYYECKSVGAEMYDGSFVGWNYWYGGGKHGEPDSIEWMSNAYNLDVKEEEQTLIVRTFTKVQNMKVGDKFTSKLNYKNVSKTKVYEITEVPWNGNEIYFTDDAGNRNYIMRDEMNLRGEPDMKLLKCINEDHPTAKLTKNKAYKTFSKDNVDKVYGIIDDEDNNVFVDFFFFRECASFLKVGDKFKSLCEHINVREDQEYEVIGVKDNVWVYFVDDSGSENRLSNVNLYKLPNSCSTAVVSNKVCQTVATMPRTYTELNEDKFKSKINFDVNIEELITETEKLMSDIHDAEANLELLQLKLEIIKKDGEKRNVIHVGQSFIHRTTGDKYIMLKLDGKYSLHDMNFMIPHAMKFCDTIEEATACMQGLPFDFFFRKVKLEFKDL